MRLTIALLVLINAYFLNARSIPSDGVLQNPCTVEGLYSLQFYYPYPQDETRYIECDPWGAMSIKECPTGSKWNTWLSSCILPVPQEEMPKGDQAQQPTLPQQPFCTFYGNWSCQNGGICNQFLTESRCFCLTNFTGDYCQTSGASTGAFGQFINETFSLDLYKRQRPLANDSLSFNTSFDTSLILDEATRQRVQKYLGLYPNGEMRFDTLINYLVQDFLSQLYPSAFFMREFTLDSEIEQGYSMAIPNLLQTAKYSYDRFDNFYLIFEEVLDRLVEYLPKHMPKVREEAQSFFEVYDMIFTRFSSINNVTVNDNMENRTELTRDEMKQKIYDDFNATLSYSYDLFRYLNRFDDDLSVKGQNYTVEEMQYAVGNFSLDPETVRMLSEIHMRSTEIWDSLSFYGFWYVISSYVTLPEVDANGNKRPYLIDEKKPVFGALLGGEEPDVEQPEGGDHTDMTDMPELGELKGQDKKTAKQAKVGALIGESTTVTPRVGALVGESTTVTPRVGSLIGESTTVLPRAGALVGESTTVEPRVGSLVGESTTVTPRVGSLIGESTTVLPRTGALFGESTTIEPRVGSLVGESTTVLPRVGALVGESTTVTPRVGSLVGESTTPIVGQLIGESTTVTPRVDALQGQKQDKKVAKPAKVGALIGESTTVEPRVGSLIGESTTVTPKVGALVGESTTVEPRVGSLVGESTTVLPRAGALIGESTTPIVGESTTVTPRVGALQGQKQDKKVAKPAKVGALIGESTTVLPRSGALVGESTTVEPRVGSLIGESTTVTPKVGALVGESTTVTPRVGSLIAESTTITPRVGSLIGESTTILPRVGSLVGESTTPISGLRALIAESTTILPKVGSLIGESTTTVFPPEHHALDGSDMHSSTDEPSGDDWF